MALKSVLQLLTADNKETQDSYLAHQRPTQSVGPRLTRPCPGHQWILTHGHHWSIVRWSRGKSDLHIDVHVRLAV